MNVFVLLVRRRRANVGVQDFSEHEIRLNWQAPEIFQSSITTIPYLNQKFDLVLPQQNR